MRRAAALLALLGWGCAERSLRVIGEVPPEVAYVALLVEQQNEALTSSGLLPWAEGSALQRFLQTTGEIPEGATAIVAGYSASQIALFPSLDDLGDRRVRRAAPGGPRLPSPDWSSAGEVRDGRAELGREVGGLALTFDGLPGCSALLAGPPVGVVHCLDAFCRAETEALSCRTRFQLDCEAAVQSQVIVVDTDLGGTLSASLDDAPCEQVTREGDGALVTECGGCRSIFFGLAQPSVGKVEALKLVDRATGEPLGDPAEERGWLLDFARVPGCDATGVAILREGADPAAAARRLAFVDLARFQTTLVRAYADSDFLAIEPDPGGDGVIAAVASARGLSLVRYGCTGDPVQEVLVQSQPVDRALRLQASEGEAPPELLLAWATTSTGAARGRLASIEPRDLQVQVLRDLPDVVRIGAIQPVAASRIAVAGDLLTPVMSGSVVWLVPRTGSEPLRALDLSHPTLSERATSFAALPAPPTLFGVFGDGVSEAALRVAALSPGLDEPGFQRRVQDYAAPSRPSAIRAYGEGRAVLTLVPPGQVNEGPQGDTVAVLVDLAAERILGGRTPIGYGPALIAAGSEEAVYFLMTWTGTLVRWTPGARPI